MRATTLTVRLENDLRDRLDAAATRLDRSLAWIIRQALTDWLDRNEQD